MNFDEEFKTVATKFVNNSISDEDFKWEIERMNYEYNLNTPDFDDDNYPDPE
jgi:hypothetical protein